MPVTFSILSTLFPYFCRAGFRVETCPMLESGSDRSPPPPKIGCSSRGYLEKELPPSSSKIRKHGFEACSSPGQQPQRRPPPPKILGVPPAGPARVWAWTCSSVGLGPARVRALLLQKYSGSPLWGLLECVLCAALLLQKYSSKNFGGCAANAFLLLLDMGS